MITCVGHWCLRQDDAPVGSHNRTVHHNHGHSLGDFAPSNLFWTLWFILPWSRSIRWELRRSYPTVRRWYLGNVPGLRRCRTVLGVRARQWQRRWRGSIVGQSVSLTLCGKFAWTLNPPPHAVRTGQPHRTLLGHTAPVTCLQFDETHVVTGSLDKSLRVGPVRCFPTFD